MQRSPLLMKVFALLHPWLGERASYCHRKWAGQRILLSVLCHEPIFAWAIFKSLGSSVKLNTMSVPGRWSKNVRSYALFTCRSNAVHAVCTVTYNTHVCMCIVNIIPVQKRGHPQYKFEVIFWPQGALGTVVLGGARNHLTNFLDEKPGLFRLV